MKKSRVWLVIPVYWILFFVYSLFLDFIWAHFPVDDFVVGSDAYHYGPCSFSVTVSLVLLILGIVYTVTRRIKEKGVNGSKRTTGIVIGALILSFVIQFFFYLSYFSIFFLFGIVVW